MAVRELDEELTSSCALAKLSLAPPMVMPETDGVPNPPVAVTQAIRQFPTVEATPRVAVRVVALPLPVLLPACWIRPISCYPAGVTELRSRSPARTRSRSG